MNTTPSSSTSGRTRRRRRRQRKLNPPDQVESSASCYCKAPQDRAGGSNSGIERLARHCTVAVKPPQTRAVVQERSRSKARRSNNSKIQDPLIPGLPDDLAIQCLIRVPRVHHGAMRGVCRRWRRLLSGNFFYSLRRSSGMAEEWLYIIKRNARDGRISWQAFDPRFRAWRRLPPLPPDFADALGFGCAVLGGCHLYLLGGKDPLKGSMRRVVFYSARTNQWHRAPEMLRRRHFLAAATVGGRLCVAGGEAETAIPGAASPMCSAEAYDPALNSWSYLPAMGTAMVPFIGVVYGGNWFLKGLVAARHVASEVYIPAIDGWAPALEGMAKGWRNPSACLGDRLYALGCPDGCKLSVYDPSSDTWQVSVDSKAHLGTTRAVEAAALLPLSGGRLCIVRNNMSITTVHLDGRSGRWESMAGKGQFRSSVSNLLSSIVGGGKLKSHIVHCQVLQA